MSHTQIATDILTGEHPVISITDTSEWFSLIQELHSQLKDSPKSANNFIKYVQSYFPPEIACYTVLSAFKNQVIERNARVFQSMLIFENEFKNLMPHITDDYKYAEFEASLMRGKDFQSMQLELTSPFQIQDESEIGTGSYDKNHTDIKKLFDVSEEVELLKKLNAMPTTHDGYFPDNGEFLYQVISRDTVKVVSASWWDYHKIDDPERIEDYVKDVIPHWNLWIESEPGILTYMGSETAEEIIQGLGNFTKQCLIPYPTSAKDAIYQLVKHDVISVDELFEAFEPTGNDFSDIVQKFDTQVRQTWPYIFKTQDNTQVEQDTDGAE